MTNQIAIFVALLILGLFMADWLFFDAGLPLFLGRKLADLIEYLSFWR